MCTNPRKIVNPTRFYYEGATKHDLIVPCGKCEHCRSQKAQDWHLRIWSEVKKYNDAGGKVVFVTFTYKPECLPVFKWSDQSGVQHEVSCFSKKDKNKFLNHMRKSQERLGYTGKDGLPLRYIWACEYAKDKRYTRRPHYHVLLMFPKPLLDLLNLKSENQFKKYIQSFWPYGWCRWSKPQSKGGKGIFVVDEFAGEYVSKYMMKDLDFYENPALSEFLYDKDGNLIKENLQKMKDKLPTHWQSLQFGAGLCDIYNNEDALINGVDFHLTGDIQKGRSKKNRAPRYVRRKLLYTKDYENRRYVLSDFGVQVTVHEFLSTFQDRTKKLKDFFNPSELSKQLSSLDIQEIFQDNSVRFNSVQELVNYSSDLLGSRRIEEIYLYDQVWSGLFSIDSMVALDGLPYDDFVNTSLEQYLLNQNKHFGEIKGFCEEGVFKSDYKFDGHMYYYSSCSRFDGFSEILKYIHMCDSFIQARTCKHYFQEREQKLSMNRELCDFEQRIERGRLGPGFHGLRPHKPLSPEFQARKERLLSKLNINR